MTYDEQEKKVEDACKEAGLKPPFTVFYSAYVNEPGDNLDKLAVRGKAIFVEGHDPFWGEGSPYFGEVLENPTWLDMCVEAERMIRTTGDVHHQFLEGVHPTGDERDGVPLYAFIMGS